MQRSLNFNVPEVPIAEARTPRAVWWGGTLAIGALVLGAVYLVIVRGDALMLDLSVLSGFAFCF